ncbi:MAG: hypothetical protein HYZ53_13020 [Planctomycetes bacterium]|nr:hypothetical protein [Planctomycetota bacterium]
MKIRLLACLLGIAAPVALSGCVVHSDPYVHVHNSHCGHYYDGATYVYSDHHVHGAGCGHAYLGGRWHVHTSHCWCGY